MNASTTALLADPELLAVREAQFDRLRALFAGERLDHAFVLCGINGACEVDAYREPERWLDGALDSLAEQRERALDPLVFRPLCIEQGYYGVHFVDRMFGANVYFRDDQWWSDPLDLPVGELQPPDLEPDETWALARRLAEAFVARDVPVPLFGLATIASPLNIAVNLFGDPFLMAMAAEPEAARHALRVITDVLCALHRWYLAHLRPEQLQPVVAAGRCQPPGYGQLCGCTTHLLSAEQYRGMVAPFDDELLQAYPHGGMIHLCGAHAQHTPTWREMASVRAVQVNDRATEDLGLYFRELREDQIIYVNPTSTMPVERVMDITGGRRVVIVADVAPPPRH